VGRKCEDWLSSFITYASHGEAPKHVYFWVGAATLAGALRRRVWIDQAYFQWYPNLYVVLVAPPGIVSKSTTADIGMSLLRQVPNIRFGPAVITWQALVQSFAAAAEMFELNGEWLTMSPMTISSSEFGNLLNPHDKDMVDMLVNLWDGKSFDKKTKMSGDDAVVNPWLNIVACTTPEWIAGSFPEYMIGGGFTSRCLFVYAEEKERYVAYPRLAVPPNLKAQAADLVHDLEWVSTKIAGEYVLNKEALDWGEAWYERHYKVDAKGLEPSRYGGYVARKQTHMHKLAMILAASSRDELVITKDDLETAYGMVTTLEAEMPKVFDKIGMKNEAVHMERIEALVILKNAVPYSEVYKTFGRQFPRAGELEEVLTTLLRSGRIRLEQRDGSPWFVACFSGAAAAKPDFGSPSFEVPPVHHSPATGDDAPAQTC